MVRKASPGAPGLPGVAQLADVLDQVAIEVQPFEEHRCDADGHEDSARKVSHDDGTIRSNYVVRNGRRYGTPGPKGCVGVDKAG